MKSTRVATSAEAKTTTKDHRRSLTTVPNKPLSDSDRRTHLSGHSNGSSPGDNTEIKESKTYPKKKRRETEIR